MSASPAVRSPAAVDRPRPSHLAPVTVYACLALCTLLLIGTANRGFGLTDEAFYLAWIGAPGQYRASITPFGPPLHLMFELLARSLIALRIAGVLLLLISGAVLGRALGRYYHAIGMVQVPVPALTALGAISGLSYYALWIMTPSYNLLANAGGALILAGGFGWAAADATGDRRGGIGAAALIGIGGCVAFFGKPPFAAVAALCIAALVVRTALVRGVQALVVRLLVLAATCLVPLIAIIALSVGFSAFAGSLAEGVRVLNFGNSPLSIPIKTAREILQVPLFLLAAPLFILVLAWSRANISGAGQPHLRWTFAAMLAVVGLYAIFQLVAGIAAGERAWTFVGLPTGCLAMIVLAAGALRSERPAIPLAAILPPVVLLVVPFATALGTANRFVHQTGASPYGFLLAAAVAAFVYFDRRTAERIQAGTALFTLAMLLWSATKPYSLTGTIIAQNTLVRVPFSSDAILVSPETQRYAQALRHVAAANRLLPGTAIIDLSGGGPGTALFLNAGAPYYPWLLADTRIPGSLPEQAWLSLTGEQQRHSWIVGPIRTEFRQTRLGRTLLARRSCYHVVAGLEKVFWDKPGQFEIWVPQRSC